MKAANRLLFGRDSPTSDECVRRAISTVYYALFHDVARAAADYFVGKDRRGTPGYTIIYRAFSHTRMKVVFDEIDRDQLRRKYEDALRRKSVSQELRNFGRTFNNLQENRNLADYHPDVLFTPSEADSLIFGVEMSLGTFERINPDERCDVLALLLIPARD